MAQQLTCDNGYSYNMQSSQFQLQIAS